MVKLDLGWQTLEEGMRKMLSDRSGRMNAKQIDMADTFYGVVREWAQGEITTQEAMQMTWGGWARAQIVMSTPKEHADYVNMQRMIQAITEMDTGGIWTTLGFFTTSELADHQGKIDEVYDYETGSIEQAIAFPTSYYRDFDGKFDRNKPIYGVKPKIRPERDERESRPKPPGYDEWMSVEDLTTVDADE
jgi:hypothetical protein